MKNRETQLNLEENNTKDKVTVLGKTFTSEEERRAYFREELRKKLPELKKMEGFPIGEDEDILNLSDPPYYTACPNPWLNDFIAEWEGEKEQLEKEGKRSANFEVEEPYAADVSEGKNNPIYMAHSYHTKVPHPAIMRYLLHYTQPGDIVFDGFAGTGMTGVAANMCGIKLEIEKLRMNSPNHGIRHSICSDLSPIATLIAAVYNNKFDAISFRNKAKAILEKIKANYGWMYETDIDGFKGHVHYFIWSDVYICENCSTEITHWNEAYNEVENELKNEFHCPKCNSLCFIKNMESAKQTLIDPLSGNTIVQSKKIPVRNNFTINGKRTEKNISSKDLQVIDKINQMKIYNLELAEIPDGDESGRTRRRGISYVHQMFTKRNLIIIDRIYKEVKDDIFLLAWLTSGLQNISKMWKFKPDRKGGTLAGTLYIPSLNIEQNPFNVLDRKISSFVKIQYKTRGESAVSLMSATNASVIKDNSVDYIFTDPPFGSNLMYSELSSIWEGVIRIHTNNSTEAIVNKSQNKSLINYQGLMLRSLKEYYRILKPGKWMTVEFSNTSAVIWNSIQTAIQNAGFVISNVAGLDRKQGTFKTVTTSTAVKQDLVISCYKSSSEFDTKFQQNKNTEVAIWDFVEEHLNHLPVHLVKDNSTTAIIERSPKILFDRLIAFYVQKGLPVPLDAGVFQKGLRERFVERDGMFFTHIQVQEYDKKKAENPEFIQLSLLVSSEQDGVMWLKSNLSEKPLAYQDLQPLWMLALAGVRKGDVIPELADILEENFLKDDAGRWYVPDAENEADLEQLRTKRLLKQFEAYRTEAAKPKGKIKEVRVDALRAGFKQAYQDKDFATIVQVGDRIPNNLLMEDEFLLQFYDIASSRV